MRGVARDVEASDEDLTRGADGVDRDLEVLACDLADAGAGREANILGPVAARDEVLDGVCRDRIEELLAAGLVPDGDAIRLLVALRIAPGDAEEVAALAVGDVAAASASAFVAQRRRIWAGDRGGGARRRT